MRRRLRSPRWFAATKVPARMGGLEGARVGALLVALGLCGCKEAECPMSAEGPVVPVACEPTAAERAEGAQYSDVAELPELGRAPLGTAIVDELEPVAEFEGVAVVVREAQHANGRLRFRKHVRLSEGGEEVDHGPDWRWWDNGQIRLRRTWREGRVDGLFEDWHKSGFQKSVGEFVGDLPQGLWRRWYATGEARVWEEFDGGVRKGLEVRWHKTGAPMHQKVWSGGREDGVIREWGPQGWLTIDGTMAGGERVGEWRECWPDGSTRRISRFAAGTPHGEWVEFHESGGTRVRGTYESGLRAGRWEAWSESGVTLVVENFREDRLEGERAVWSASGALIASGGYRGGRSVGVHLEWGEEGNMVMRRTHEDPPGSDRVERWWSGGALRSRGLMVEGRRDGIWEAWREDGVVEASIAGVWRLGERVGE